MLDQERLTPEATIPPSYEQREEARMRLEKLVDSGEADLVAVIDKRSPLRERAERMSPEQVEWFMRNMDRMRVLEAEGRAEEAHILLERLWDGAWKGRYPEDLGSSG